MRPEIATGILVALSLLTSPAAELPPAQEIIQRYIDATGGRAALEKLKTRVMSGKIEVLTMNVGGKFEVRAKVPNKQTSKMEFEAFGVMREGFDGSVAWTQAPGQSARVKSGGELARAQRTTWFPRELRLSDAYARFETKGAAKIGTQDTWVVEATPTTGKPDKLHFDQKTGLLIREVSLVDTPIGALTFEIELSDYREFDGVKVPCSVRVPKPAEMGFHIKIDDVKHNGELADSEFLKPKD